MDYNFLPPLVLFVALSTILGLSSERELRPSDHGLAYQEGSSPPAQNRDAKQMLAFFGATPSTPSVLLPEARNISDSWWSARGNGSRPRDLGKDRVRLGLLVGSAVCGLIGVALLVVSGVVFLRRLRKQPSPKSQRVPSTSAPTFSA